METLALNYANSRNGERDPCDKPYKWRPLQLCSAALLIAFDIDMVEGIKAKMVVAVYSLHQISKVVQQLHMKQIKSSL